MKVSLAMPLPFGGFGLVAVSSELNGAFAGEAQWLDHAEWRFAILDEARGDIVAFPKRGRFDGELSLFVAFDVSVEGALLPSLC